MTFDEWLDKNELEYASVYKKYAEEVENPESLIDFLENEWKKSVACSEDEVTQIDEHIVLPEPVKENFDMIYADITAVDTGSHLSLYRDYAEEEMSAGNDNFKTFSEFRDSMNA